MPAPTLPRLNPSARDCWVCGWRGMPGIMVCFKKKFIGDPLRQIVPEDIPLACRLLYGTAFLGLLVFCAVKLFILF